MPIEFNDKTPRKKQRRPRMAPDVQRLAKALSGPGIDTRVWYETGTVGVEDSNGEFVTDDPEAIYADRLGAVVRVRLDPGGQLINAKWNGLGCGRMGFILFPLRPGDQVGVSIPGGNFNSPNILIRDVISDWTAQIPEDWNNDRALFQFNVPLDIRAPAIRMSSSNLKINNRKVNYSGEPI